MKKRLKLINFFFGMTVLASMLLQSADSYEHLVQQFSEKICHHQYNSPSEITHQHHNFDHCSVCEFTFSSFLSPETCFFKFDFCHKEIPYFFTLTTAPESFSGCATSLRGPPSIIA